MRDLIFNSRNTTSGYLDYDQQQHSSRPGIPEHVSSCHLLLLLCAYGCFTIDRPLRQRDWFERESQDKK